MTPTEEKTKNPMGLSDEAVTALLSILEIVEREDEYIRLQQMKQYKKNNLFWHGFQYLFWSEIDQDWRIPTHEQLQEVSAREEISWIYNYVINHFKAHGESIIAALSSDIPEVRFGPRDATNPLDRRSVEAANNAVEVIEKWNKAKLLIINALFYLCCEGLVAAYTYNIKDEKYGTTSIPVYNYKMQQTTPDIQACTQCGYQAEEENVQGMNEPCPQCGGQMETVPGLQEQVPVQVDETIIPKGREIVEIYGALDVRVPAYARKQADCGWLVHYVDANPALIKDTYPNVADQITPDPGQDYPRLMRQSSLAMEGFQLNIRLGTVKKCWFRPWMLNNLQADDPALEELKKAFPDGIYIAVNEKILCDARNESLDDCWTLSKAGPSKGMHSDPLLQSFVQVQELRNNLSNLLIMQVEYGIPSTYADNEVFDFEGQSQQEVAPGYIYPVTPRPGQAISEAFFTDKTSNLSKDATDLIEQFDTDGQFLTGDYPSVYGGASSGGSKTLGEYERSRTFALQRLALVWYFINDWWAETMHKSVLSFIKNQIEDTPITSKQGNDFQTKWIKQADFQGSFDRLDPEASADFPVSFSQKRSVLMTLFQANNPEILQILGNSDNIEFVKSCVGLDELKIPDGIQRNKQLREVVLLMQSAPRSPEMSSVPVEKIDDHAVHKEVLVNFMCGDVGQDLKENQPEAYANCLAHWMEHDMMEQQANMPPGAMPPVGPPGLPQAPPQPQPPQGVM